MWGNCMNDVDRLWVTSKECAFVKTPCFDLLCFADSQIGEHKSMYGRLGGDQSIIACELRMITRSFYTYVSFVGSACWEACIIGESGIEFGVS